VVPEETKPEKTTKGKKAPATEKKAAATEKKAAAPEKEKAPEETKTTPKKTTTKKTEKVAPTADAKSEPSKTATKTKPSKKDDSHISDDNYKQIANQWKEISSIALPSIKDIRRPFLELWAAYNLAKKRGDKALPPKQTIPQIPGFELYPNFVTPNDHDDFVWSIEEARVSGKLKRLEAYTDGVEGHTKYFQILEFSPNIISDMYSCSVYDKELLKADMPGWALQEYYKGGKIKPHVDLAYHGEKIFYTSFMSDATLIFECMLPSSPYYSQKIPIVIPSRSAYSISGEARWAWLHSLEPAPKKKIYS